MSPTGSSVLVTGGTRGIGLAIALRLVARRRDARRARLHAERRRPRRQRRRRPRGRRRAGARARERRVAERRRGARGGGPVPRRRPQRGDRRDPARARDRGQALGLDARRERPLAARARARDRAGDGAGLARSSPSRASARSASSTTTSSSARRRRRSSRSSATSPSSSAPRGIRVNAVSGGVVETEALDFFPNKDEMLRTVERTPAGRLVDAGRHRRRGLVPVLPRRGDGPRPDARSSTAASRCARDGADRLQPAHVRRGAPPRRGRRRAAADRARGRSAT